MSLHTTGTRARLARRAAVPGGPLADLRPRKRRVFAASCIAAVLSLGLAQGGPRATTNKTALDRYVFAPDPSYRYEIVRTNKAQGFTELVVDMVSQEWRTAAEVDRPQWRHWLTIVIPDQLRSTTAFLLIDGGSNGREAPRGGDLILGAVAARSQTVMAHLRMVPNEPLTFKDENRSRTEDEIIAYTWDKFLRTGDETWPLRLPMTKSAVRAMDTVTAVCAAQGKTGVEKFFVAGASKRGWTTWTTAAVDDRVVAIAPIVIDVLNGEKSIEHHYRAYGFWAPAVQDYVDMHIMDWAGTAPFRNLMRIEDPYSYRDRLTMPKLIVNATGDQYFPLDSSQFYFDGLKGEKHLRYVPNAKHNLANSDALATIQAFYESVIQGVPRPRYTWKFEGDSSIVATAADKPVEVRLWQATNPKARDFRLDTLGPAFKSTPLEADSSGRYSARVAAPPEGWTAFFVELTFPGPGGTPLKLTSGVRILPDKLPGGPPPKNRP